MIEIRIPWSRLPPPPTPVKRLHYDLQLMLGARLKWFLIADGLLLLYAFYHALIEASGFDDAYGTYVALVLVPFFFLALPAMTSVVSLERTAGSLDLALAVRSTERYFARRVLAICGLFAVQGVAVLWLVPFPRLLPKLGAMLNVLAIAALFASIVLFWMVRVRTSGAVFVGSLLTAASLSKWILSDPFPPRLNVLGPGGIGLDTLRGIPVPFLLWAWNLTVLLLAAALLFVYAQRRLRRPESML